LLHLLSDLGFVTGVDPQGASASKEPEGSPERSEGDSSASSAADAAMLDVLYGDLPPYQPMAAEKSGVVGAIAPQVPSLLSEVPVSSELRVVTNPTSPTQVVMPGAPEAVISPSFAVADVLVSMRTPPRSHLACPTAVDAPASSSAVISAGLVDCSEVVPLPKADEVENDFIGGLVDSFYNSLEQTIGLVLTGSPVPFSKLKVILSRGIDCI